MLKNLLKDKSNNYLAIAGMGITQAGNTISANASSGSSSGSGGGGSK